MTIEHISVLIVGAGLSGIGAAYHLQTECPDRSYAILEGRERSGGTWDLFRFPGIRSDSDMHTLGYSFRPWKQKSSIGDGESILNYLRETATEYGIDKKIRFGHRVTGVSWSSETSRWTVDVKRMGTGEEVRFTCDFLFMCSGYYDYDKGYTPQFKGVERFGGRVVHPQFWTDDIDYRDKRVVVIGSGATAVTLIPELAREAAHVTMLQRSPTYMLSMPATDPFHTGLSRALPPRVAQGITRWKNVLLSMAIFGYARRSPSRMKKLLIGGVKRALGPDYDVETHFTPHYNPWEQRLCLVSDGDLFKAIRSGRASVVTDHIDTFTERGLLLSSGAELEADLIVTATGLKLLFLAGLEVTVDGERVEPKDTTAYRGVMFSDVPNMALTFGYTNASWTLRADLSAGYVCRLLNHMKKKGYRRCVPRIGDANVSKRPFLDFSSGYVQRSIADMPKQGSEAPWKVNQNYLIDIKSLRYSDIDDGVMEFR
jgi:monooxygenase